MDDDGAGLVRVGDRVGEDAVRARDRARVGRVVQVDGGDVVGRGGEVGRPAGRLVERQRHELAPASATPDG